MDPEFLRYTSQSNEKANWLTFGVCAKRAVAKAIEDYQYKETARRRHYNQDTNMAVDVITNVILNTTWLWSDLAVELSNYQKSWNETKRMLKRAYPEYELVFSELMNDASRKLPFFMVQINSKRKFNSRKKDSVLGCLCGAITGNAVSARYELSSFSAAVRAAERDMLDNNHLPMLGGGPFSLQPGQITNQCEQLLYIARRNTVHDIAFGLLEWYYSGVMHIDNLTTKIYSAIDRKKGKEYVYKQLIENAKNNNDSECLICVIPLVSKGVDSKFVTGVCRLINKSLIARDACITLYNALNYAVMGYPCQQILDKILQENHIQCIKDAINADKTTHNTDIVGVLQNTFYELQHSKSLEESIIRVISRGGEMGITSCVTGALLGAYYGFSTIPQDWIRQVTTAKNPRSEQFPDLQTNDLLKLACQNHLKK